MENDSVNHPKHYDQDVYTRVECIMFTRNMSFNIGNAFKYVWRAGKKDDTADDLRKAIWYLCDAIDFREQCNYRFLMPFLPSESFEKWKIDTLKYILDNDFEFAITEIRCMLQRITYNTRLMESPSTDEIAQGG